MSTISMREIENRYDSGEGRHWFDTDTMKFFRTRLPAYGYEGVAGVFFTSSEKPPHGKRMHSVRQLVGPGDIDTRGDFCCMTQSRATRLAQKLASGELKFIPGDTHPETYERITEEVKGGVYV